MCPSIPFPFTLNKGPYSGLNALMPRVTFCTLRLTPKEGNVLQRFEVILIRIIKGVNLVSLFTAETKKSFLSECLVGFFCDVRLCQFCHWRPYEKKPRFSEVERRHQAHRTKDVVISQLSSTFFSECGIM